LAPYDVSRTRVLKGVQPDLTGVRKHERERPQYRDRHWQMQGTTQMPGASSPEQRNARWVKQVFRKGLAAICGSMAPEQPMKRDLAGS